MKNTPKLESSGETKPESMIEQEKHEVEIKIETLDDIFDSLKYSFDLAGDERTKRQIGHQLVKLEAGLKTAGLNAEDIKVEDTPDGVLGLFYLGSGDIALSNDMVNDFETSTGLIAHVLVHERTHSEGIADEGMTELKTNRQLPPMLKFYISEQNQAKSTFHKLGLSKALELYDIDDPEELAEAFIETETEAAFKNNKNIRAKDLAHKLENMLKDGVPRFHERLIERAYRINKRVEYYIGKLGAR